VLVEWQEGGMGTRTDLNRLLRFLVRVRGWELGVAREGSLDSLSRMR
jgi:hypothetical protein